MLLEDALNAVQEQLQPLDQRLLWIIIVAFIIAFLLAFSVGANDVSNSFGTSVGSKVLTVTQACILATFFEVAGSALLGYSVCEKFRKGMYKLELYQDSQKELMLGQLACLIGSASWNILATVLKMPISGTHSIVGATIGFSLVSKGLESIQWMKILQIVGSWFASPLLAGAISSAIYLLINKTIISKVDPLKYGLKALPLFYGATIFINVISVVLGGENGLNIYKGLFIALLIAGATITAVALLLVPRLKRQITDELVTNTLQGGKRPPPTKASQAKATTSPGTKTGGFDNVVFKPDVSTKTTGDSASLAKAKREITLSPNELADGSKYPPVAPKPAFLLKRQQAAEQQDSPQLEEVDLGPQSTKGLEIIDMKNIRKSGPQRGAGKGNRDDKPGTIGGERTEVFRLFSSLQILTACFASFAHGSNDVSNAVAPLIPIWNIYATGAENTSIPTQTWILLFGGIGICTGLWAWGRAVMGTVGEGLTKLTPSKGFAIELGAAISVLSASKLGLPISTTHCKVGSVVIVGLVSSKFCSQDKALMMNDGNKESDEPEQEQTVDWKLFGNIAITWVVTVPLAAAASALVMFALRWLV